MQNYKAKFSLHHIKYKKLYINNMETRWLQIKMNILGKKHIAVNKE